jgi:hypothetical protein
MIGLLTNLTPYDKALIDAQPNQIKVSPVGTGYVVVCGQHCSVHGSWDDMINVMDTLHREGAV